MGCHQLLGTKKYSGCIYIRGFHQLLEIQKYLGSKAQSYHKFLHIKNCSDENICQYCYNHEEIYEQMLVQYTELLVSLLMISYVM